MRFKRIIALLLVFTMVMPIGLIHAADLVWKDDAVLMKQMPSGLTDLESIIDVTDESYEAEIIVSFMDGMLAYSPDYVQLSIVEENPVGKRIVGNKLLIDKGAPAGTITIKAILDGDFYTIRTITILNSDDGNPQLPQAHSLTLTVKDADKKEPLEGVLIEIDAVSLVDTNPLGVAVIDVVGTETVRLSKEGYKLATLSASDLSGSTLEVRLEKRISGPRITHIPPDASDLNNLSVSVTALDDSVQHVQMRTFYKHAYGIVPGDIVSLTRESNNSSVFSADITYQVKSKIRDYNALELIYFFTMSDEDGGFLQYPEVVDMNSLEGALTVKLADPPDLSTVPIVEHTPPVVTSFDSIPATFTITQLQEGEIPTINVYYRTELNSNSLSIVKAMGQLIHVAGDTYTVDLANPEFKQLEAHTIEYYISTNRGYQWFYYPQGMNPYTLTGLYSTSIPRKLYGPEEPEEPELNKANLIAKINDAKDLYSSSVTGNGLGEYPGEVMDAFNTAIEAASHVKDTAITQAQIDAAYQDLMGSVTAFKAGIIKGASRSDLMDKYGEAIILYRQASIGEEVGQHPQQAVDALVAAYVATEDVLNNPASTDEEIDNAYQSLSDAIQVYRAAQIKAGNSKPLQDKVLEAWRMMDSSEEGNGSGQYPSSAFNDLRSAVSAAEHWIIFSGTEVEINKAYGDMVNAIQVFLNSKNTGPNKEALQGAIEAARAFLNASLEGTKVGQYPAGSKDIMRGFIDTAFATLTDLFATQIEVDQALTFMNNSLRDFKASILVQGNTLSLHVTIIDAKALLDNSSVGEGAGQFPSDAMHALEAAIGVAEAAISEPMTQSEIDSAQQALDTEITIFKAAEIKAADKTALQGKIDDATFALFMSRVGTDVGQYPSLAVDVLKAAIKAAKEVFEHPATQAQIDAAKANLEASVTAFKNAVNTKGDSEEADAVVTEAGTLLKDSVVGEGVGEYPLAAKTALEAAIAAAKAVFEQPSTQAQIDAAKATLEAAITTFKNAVNTKGDGEEADAVVTEAGTLLKDIVVGEGVGEYPLAAKTALEAAITAAKEVFSKPSTQAEINAAKQALEAAVAAFKAAVIKAGDTEEIQTKINTATTLLNESTEGNGLGQYPAGSKAILQAAITAAENVIRTAATQAEIEKANEQLTAAYNTFQAAVIKTVPVDSYTPPVNSYTPPVTTQPVAVQPSTKITDGLNTVETGQGTVTTATSEVLGIMKAAKPVILESTLAVIDFGKNGLNVPELKQGLNASLELGILVTEKSKTDEVLAGAKLDQAGLQPLGGKVLDLIAKLNYTDGTSTRIKSFVEPVKVTINLKELGLTGDTTNLTAVRFVPQADGTYKTIKLGGLYIPATNSFEFYTDSFSLYSIVKADSLTKITFKVDSKEYSIGARAMQTDVPPVILEQRTLVPIRAVAEALGAEVEWDHATKTATITLDGKVLTMTLGDLIEGMDVPAQGIDGRIMVPLRYVSEALGAYVMWFPQDKRIEVIR